MKNRMKFNFTNDQLNLIKWLSDQRKGVLAAILYDYTSFNMTQLNSKKFTRGDFVKWILDLEIVPSAFKKEFNIE